MTLSPDCGDVQGGGGAGQETFLPVPEPTLCGPAFREGAAPVTAISQHNVPLEKPAAESRCLTPLGRSQLQGSSQAWGSNGPHYQGSAGSATNGCVGDTGDSAPGASALSSGWEVCADLGVLS